jgi:hypothetical protein
MEMPESQSVCLCGVECLLLKCNGEGWWFCKEIVVIVVLWTRKALFCTCKPCHRVPVVFARQEVSVYSKFYPDMLCLGLNVLFGKLI